MRPTTVPRRHGGRNRMTYASYSRSPETRPAFLNSEANVSSVIISVTSAEISLYNVFSAGSASSSMARLIPSLSRRARDTDIAVRLLPSANEWSFARWKTKCATCPNRSGSSPDLPTHFVGKPPFLAIFQRNRLVSRMKPEAVFLLYPAISGRRKYTNKYTWRMAA